MLYDVYVFDEPSSNLDLTSIRELARIMKLLKSRGKTVILIEHRIYYAMELTDRIFYMDSGTIMEIYSCSELMKKPLSELHQMGLRASTEELSQLLPDRVVKSTYPLDKNGQMKLCEHFMSR